MTEREGRRGGDEATESSTGHDGLAGKRPRVQRRASTTPASSGSRLHPPDAALDRHDGTTRDDPFALHLAPRAATASEIATHAIERKDGGTAVDPGIAARTSATVGADVSNAKVHDDATSQAATAALGARAFAYGSDVFLGPGERRDDVELLAHELTHVSQQGAARPGVQTKIEVGGAHDPAEADADRVAAAVAGGPAAGGSWLVEQGPAGPGQLTKAAFLAQLRATVTDAASAALGDGWTATDCPYIDKYLTRYGKASIGELEAVIRKFAPATAQATAATDVLPAIAARVTDGIHSWRTTKALPAELAAIDPIGAAAAIASSGPSVQAKPTLGGLRSELGPGAALDGDVAARIGGALGADLDHVRVHTGPIAARKAAEVDASAFVVGGEVVLGDAMPAAGGPEHDALMAHELAHAAEQRDAALAPDAADAAIGDEEAPAEDRADAAAGSAVARLWSGAKRVARKAADLAKRPLTLQRCPNQPTTTNTHDRYLQEHAIEIAQSAADHLKTLPFATHDPSVTWTSAGATAFAARVAEKYRAQPQPSATTSLARPDELGHLIDSSRPVSTTQHGQGNVGEKAYFEGVGITVGNALARRIDESLRRGVPRYAQARYHGGNSSGALTLEPALERIVQSHPMDTLVIGALVGGSLVRFDGNAFATAHPDLAKAAAPARTQSRLIRLLPTDNPRWHRLIEPTDATPEEIAIALTGSATEAFRIENAHPLYGLSDESGNAAVGLSTSSAIADEASLAQAGKLGKGTRPPARVLEAMRLNATMAGGSIHALAARFGSAGSLKQLALEINERAARVEQAGDSEIVKWDMHTEAQRVILQQVASGLSVCGLRLENYSTGYGVDLKTDAGAHGLPPGHRAVLSESVEAWLTAATASNLPTSAEQLVLAGPSCAIRSRRRTRPARMKTCAPTSIPRR